MVDNESYVYVFEYVLCDDVMEIGLHELKEEVNISTVVGSDGLDELYYVGVV